MRGIQMKKSEWIYLANAMWTYSDKNEGEISRLLKELVIKVNTNMEMIIDDMENDEPNVRINGLPNTNTADNKNIKRLTEF
tara:strand:- start:290 stop:532 length:243 start_codon:yes stop_codon:yes gene_type:complete